jgi:hypothetical protein
MLYRDRVHTDDETMEQMRAADDGWAPRPRYADPEAW